MKTKILTEEQEKALKYFNTPKDPSMAELINWFQIEFDILTIDMKLSNHNVNSNEPNPYHYEDSIWTHSMLVCKQAEDGNKIQKIIALLHDVGKPMAREVIPFNAPKPDYNGEARVSTYEHGSERKFKSIFRGHEGISAWLSTDILNKLKLMLVINEDEFNQIFTCISLHGMLFNRIKDGKEFKPEKIVNIFDDIKDYNDYIQIVKNDSKGRFHVESHKRGSNADLLGKTIYTEETYIKNYKSKNIDYNLPEIQVLVGIPACGKSTYIKSLNNYTVVSKDDIIIQMGLEKGEVDCVYCKGKGYHISSMNQRTIDHIPCKHCNGNGSLHLHKYTDVYKHLSKEEHKLAYEETMKNFYKATHKGENIVIDMTNMSKKSRNKWLQQKGYRTKAIVFMTPYSEIRKRSIRRCEEEYKCIPENAYKDMMKSFLVPTLYEFDEIEFVHSK